MGKLNYNPILDGPGGSPIDIGMRPTPYISIDTTWTLAGSPYILTSNVVIEVGITLTIEPGVEIRFNSGTGLYISQYRIYDNWYHGALVAEGTADNPIIFTSNAATPSPGDWKGIL